MEMIGYFGWNPDWVGRFLVRLAAVGLVLDLAGCSVCLLPAPPA